MEKRRNLFPLRYEGSRTQKDRKARNLDCAKMEEEMVINVNYPKEMKAISLDTVHT